ncbi:MAG: sulfite exporter TauE/SafE family protein [Candidatus Dormibacteraeota bacterium]|nr:sulfite exporter TauE/SafE family protein [Candidatus Dormibacteraeota bacterium]
MSPLLRDMLGVTGGFVVGLVSGGMGIGGGILLVPMMVIGFGFAQQVAQGTSLAAIIPSALVGAVTHDRAGNLDRRAAIWVGAFGCGGAVLGALAAVHLPRALLVRLFGVLLLYSAYRLWSGRQRT